MVLIHGDTTDGFIIDAGSHTFSAAIIGSFGWTSDTTVTLLPAQLFTRELNVYCS